MRAREDAGGDARLTSRTPPAPSPAGARSGGPARPAAVVPAAGALGVQQRQHRTDRHVGAWRHDQLAHRRRREDLDVDDALVGLDQRHDVAALHAVAGLHVPLDERAGVHVGAERRACGTQLHRPNSLAHGRDDASAAGSAASSRCFGYGIGTSAVHTRAPAHRDRRKPAPRCAPDLRREAAAAPAFVDDHGAMRLRTDARIVASSSGRRLRRSTTSASMPSLRKLLRRRQTQRHRLAP